MPKLITQDYLDYVADALNNKPRKLLNFLTPSEVFMNENEKKESRVKPALPAAEVSFNLNLQGVALHIWHRPIKLVWLSKLVAVCNFLLIW